MIPEFTILDFKPLFLTVEDIGPFRDKPFRLDFTDKEDLPCNFYLLLSENGRGKTTLLDLMARLMELLEGGERESLGLEDLDNGSGRAQWDMLLRVSRDGQQESVVFSLAAGRDEPWELRPWGSTALERYGADRWCHFGYRRHPSGRLEMNGHQDALVADLLAAIRVHRGEAPVGFESDPLTLPTLLHFSAYRDIVPVGRWERRISEPHDWGYRPVHCFGREGEGWENSLDNLLVWLRWLDDDRFQEAIATVNQRVFEGTPKFLKGVKKQPPEAVVSNGGHSHRLDRLSSGEKSLVQLYLRIGTHMTRNTILLVDEMDVHLHSKWQHGVLGVFKQLASTHQGLTIIASAHARELIPAFAYEIHESGLRKGGHIIEESLG